MFRPVLLLSWGERDPAGRRVDRNTDRWAPPPRCAEHGEIPGVFLHWPRPHRESRTSYLHAEEREEGSSASMNNEKMSRDLEGWGSMCGSEGDWLWDPQNKERHGAETERIPQAFCYEIVSFLYTSPSHRGFLRLRDWKGLCRPQQCVDPGIHQQLEFDPWRA